MDKLPSKNFKINSDIRAPLKFKFLHLAGSEWRWALYLLLGDISSLAVAWSFAGYLNQFYSPLPEQLVWWVWFQAPSIFWIFATLILLFFAYAGLYKLERQTPNYLRAGQLISCIYLLSLVFGYFYDPKLDPPRSLFFTAWFASVILVVGLRLIINLLWRQFQKKHQRILVFIIAPGHRLKKLGKVLSRRSHYQIVGAALASTANTPTTFKKILESGASEVLAEDLPDTQLASNLYWQLRSKGIALRLIPSSLEILHRRGESEIFAGIPTLRLEGSLFIGWDYRVKRLLDIFGSLVGIILLSPLFITVALAIKITSPGPIFFRQERIGLHGKVFNMWKFRTMVINAAAMQQDLEKENQTVDGIMFKLKRDPRVILVGNFLRRTSIDELPQLFNILLGQMSLVGPRPLPLRDVERFDRWHHIRHQVLPGLTGLWQISGRSDIEDFNDAARLDLYYIDNWSINLDLDILAETIGIVLFGKGAY
jgi:exopolysaccharide biosynthesis polyprenyl glycosylphosphotransferase